MTFFEVEFGSSGPGEFTSSVVNSPSGKTRPAAVRLDVDTLLSGRPDLEKTVYASAVSARGVPTRYEKELRDVGQQLFEAMFSGAVLNAYRASVMTSKAQGETLRIVLRMTDPQIAALPWEALYDPEDQRYLCRMWPLVRQIPASFTPPPLAITGPVRILGLVASPRDHEQLNVAAEQENLTEALAQPIADGLIKLEWVAEATWEALQRKLLSGHWHVLHFIGHGYFDAQSDQGLLALEGKRGYADRVEADRLVDLFNVAQPTPRLVVLNACSSGEQGTTDLFASTAAALVRSGINAVAAMQFGVSDSAAIAFTQGFYTAIAEGRNVDEAINNGRIAILGTGRGTLEWVTPVLHVSGQPTRLFDVATPPPQPDEKRDDDSVDDSDHRSRTVTEFMASNLRRIFFRQIGPHHKKLRVKSAVTAAAVLGVIAWAVIAGPLRHHGGDGRLYLGDILPPRDGVTAIDVRLGPDLSSRIVANLAVHSSVYIVCVEWGDSVEGPGPVGGPKRQSTRLWDKVRIEEQGRDIGFAPDAWINTHGLEPQGPFC
jgi:hypothetical protein